MDSVMAVVMKQNEELLRAVLDSLKNVGFQSVRDLHDPELPPYLLAPGGHTLRFSLSQNIPGTWLLRATFLGSAARSFWGHSPMACLSTLYASSHIPRGLSTVVREALVPLRAPREERELEVQKTLQRLGEKHFALYHPDLAVRRWVRDVMGCVSQSQTDPVDAALYGLCEITEYEGTRIHKGLISEARDALLRIG